MPDYSPVSLSRLANLLETPLRINTTGFVEGTKSCRWAIAGVPFPLKLSIIGACWCKKEEITALLFESATPLGLVVGATSKQPDSEAFAWILDMDRLPGSHRFDAVTSLMEVMDICGKAIVASFTQKGREQPWQPLDLGEFAVA